jgi:IS30 family transposase
MEGMLKAYCSFDDIANALDKDISTIYRERKVIYKRSDLTEYITYSVQRACIEPAKNQANKLFV